MFKRRHPRTGLQKIRQTLWPSMGWLRMVKYYRARVIRTGSSAHSIAANMAGAAAMSFTPFFGIHIFGAMAFAWLIGAGMNLIAAVAGSLVGNPWTFPFLLYSAYRTGVWILTLFGVDKTHPHIDPNALAAEADTFWRMVSENFNDLFVPTAVGGLVLAIISWPVYYYLFRTLVRGAQKARSLQIRRKANARKTERSEP